MARRGKCRCGKILTFHRGPEGYKMRCPGCSSVVRLRIRRAAADDPEPLQCPCGAVLPTGELPPTCPVCERPLKKGRRAPPSPLERALRSATAPTEELAAYEASVLSVPLPEALPINAEVVSAAAAALPSRIMPSVPHPPREGPPGTCTFCGKPSPPGKKACEECAQRKDLMASIADEAVEVEVWEEEEEPRARKSRQATLRQRWLIIGVVVGTLILGVLIWALSQMGAGTV
jgi:hypothetical protein